MQRVCILPRAGTGICRHMGMFMHTHEALQQVWALPLSFSFSYHPSLGPTNSWLPGRGGWETSRTLGNMDLLWV